MSQQLSAVEEFLANGGSITVVEEGERTASPSEIYQAQNEGTSISSLRAKREQAFRERHGESTFGRLDRLTGGGYSDAELLQMAEVEDINRGG